MEKKMWFWLFVGVVVAFCAATGSGCVAGEYSSRGSALANECGAFSAESSTRGVAVSKATQNYGSACQMIQMARADAAYIRSLEATAVWYATTDGETVDHVARRSAAHAIKKSQAVRRESKELREQLIETQGAVTDHLNEEGGAQ